MSESKFQGQCYCGKCKIEATGDVMFGVICHCSICSGLHAAESVSLVGFDGDNLKLVEGEDNVTGFKSSPTMIRYFCKDCGSSVYNVSLSEEMVFRDAPFLNFVNAKEKRLDALRPTAHMFYGSRQRDVNDDLPKFATFTFLPEMLDNQGNPLPADKKAKTDTDADDDKEKK
eukprot:CAMPEP_0168591738 /NCGR_PEP_ID=MMETSP0420-20121227/7305_1 /TAXON_ID=498008 /ORGANISM="Pessonella sp." /LENGTH=171 /DNA_ID=CAMNT_0008627571 /DNA_START=27 /DNA_END=542 /DNA_ORIENTATION=-